MLVNKIPKINWPSLTCSYIWHINTPKCAYYLILVKICVTKHKCCLFTWYFFRHRAMFSTCFNKVFRKSTSLNFIKLPQIVNPELINVPWFYCVFKHFYYTNKWRPFTCFIPTKLSKIVWLIKIQILICWYDRFVKYLYQTFADYAFWVTFWPTLCSHYFCNFRKKPRPK